MITPLYAAPIAALFIALSIRIIVYRRTHKLGLGDAGDKSLMKRMRAQANCAEYAPFALVLMLLVELQDAPAPVVHTIGALLLLGRALHGYGFSTSPPIMTLRVAGTALTLLSYIVAIFALLVLGFA
jgi:uncharacterized membrane protein YecN with MAPEG domain